MAKFHSHITATGGFEHVKKLASLGPRHAATQNEKKAIDYIRSCLEGLDSLEVTLEETNPIVNCVTYQIK